MSSTRDVYYIKYIRENGQSSILNHAGSNKPVKFYNVDEVRKIAATAFREFQSFKSEKNSPARISHVSILRTRESF